MKPYQRLCIFHKEKTPSLRIWPTGRYFCYGCKERGHVEEHRDLFQEFERRLVAELERLGQLLLPGVT